MGGLFKGRMLHGLGRLADLMSAGMRIVQGGDFATLHEKIAKF